MLKFVGKRIIGTSFKIRCTHTSCI